MTSIPWHACTCTVCKICVACYVNFVVRVPKVQKLAMQLKTCNPPTTDIISMRDMLVWAKLATRTYYSVCLSVNPNVQTSEVLLWRCIDNFRYISCCRFFFEIHLDHSTLSINFIAWGRSTCILWLYTGISLIFVSLLYLNIYVHFLFWNFCSILLLNILF